MESHQARHPCTYSRAFKSTIMNITIGLVDDHDLFRKSLWLMVQSFVGFEVVVDAQNGKELQTKLSGSPTPQIMLIDVEMPVMNGRQTAQWLRETYPSIKLVALSMNDQEAIVLEMIRAGCCSYLLKDISPEELERALHEVHYKNYYNSDIRQKNLAALMMNQGTSQRLTEKEREFLQWACSDLTYKQIAQRMKITERTVDGYREALFEKLNVASRTGLALEAVRRGIIKL